MPPTLRSLIDDGRVHVFDGAMGTMLYAKGFFLNVCYDELNLKQPKLVREVHQEYVRAGAEVIETNTFGATPTKLAGYGLADETEAINTAAAKLASGSSPLARPHARRRARRSRARPRPSRRRGWTGSSSRRSAIWTKSTRPCSRCAA
jgi:methionine synthase I (cobalamin-dependent)